MYVIITDNKNEDNCTIIVRFKNEKIADKFIATYQKALWYTRFNVDFIWSNTEFVKKNYQINIIDWHNTDKFYRKLLKELTR